MLSALPDLSSSAWDTASTAFKVVEAVANPATVLLPSPSASGSWLSSLSLAKVGLVLLGFIFIAGGIALAAGDELSGAIEKVGKVAAVAA